MTIDRWISDAAAKWPDKPALIFGETVIGYAAMAALIDRRAVGLAKAGLSRGDRVGWLGMNNPEVLVLLFACARIGAMLLPFNWRLAATELAEIAADCAPRIIFHDAHFGDAAARLARPNTATIPTPVPDAIRDLALPAKPPDHAPGSISEDDPILIVYTSGSTGAPKGAVLTQKALIANAAMSVEAHELTPADHVLNVLPMFHVGGLNILPTPAFSVGATVVLHEKFEAGPTARDLTRVDAAIVVPTVLQAVMATPEWAAADLSALRVLSIGSTDVPPELIEAVHGRGVPVIQIYGAAETGPVAIYQRRDQAFTTVGSIGRRGSGCDIRLVRDDGQAAETGEPGEIWVRGDNVASHYWNRPDLTAEALHDGWFRTGDVARRDAGGLYWFTDRIKHVIISGGENIYPAEIERLFRQHPNVAEVAVVGRADAKWGEVPVAVVTARGDTTAQALLVALDGKIARFKRPREVIFVDALPRNAMGKVVVGEVRRMIAFP